MIKIEIQFSTERINQEVINFQTLHLTPEQKKIVSPLVHVISQRINIREMALKGFLWRVLRDFQEKRGMRLDRSMTLTPTERIQGLVQIFMMLKNELTKILIDEQEEPKLEKALMEALELYKSKFVNR
ncbi:MAG: hypothetical protein ACFFC3_07625 [Candidatus Odinarchaeota archaeon]